MLPRSDEGLWSIDHRTDAGSTDADDAELLQVKDWLESEDPSGRRTARIIRETYDQLYDGQRTGRYSWAELHKTEKTHMGTLIEINLHREFRFDDGEATDYRIAGVEVDCKFSMGLNKWMIPTEAMGHICLVIWANDETSSWSAGLVRVSRERLGGGDHGNRDGKRTLNQLGRDSVVNLWDTPGDLAENLLLHLTLETREAILTAGSARPSGSGQARVNELFRLVQGRIIDRNTVATIARQSDYMKRVRYDGGARSRLRDGGVIILGHQKQHQRIAADLMLPVPRLGEFVSVQVVPIHEQAGAATRIGDSWWTRAAPGDPIVPAPKLGEGEAG